MSVTVLQMNSFDHCSQAIQPLDITLLMVFILATLLSVDVVVVSASLKSLIVMILEGF